MKIKKVLTYVIIFLLTVLICVIALVGTAKIPKESIQKQMQESATFYKTVKGIERKRNWREYSYIYYSMDSVLLSIIYCVDTEHPLSSVMQAKFYQRVPLDINDNFIELVEEDKEPDSEYMRYWHGSMVILRPLLTIFSIQEIYQLNTIIMWILIGILFVLLFKKDQATAIMFAIGLAGIAIAYASTCLEYIWTILMMLIVSIIVICIEEKKSNILNCLFMITGILTCYFDFLTTEMLTILLPILLVLMIRRKEERLTNVKEGLQFIIVSLIFWSIGYIGMFIAKWVIASIVLNLNVFEYATSKAMVRVNGSVGELSGFELSIKAIQRNVNNLIPISNIVKHETLILSLTVIGVLVCEFLMIDRKKIKKMWFSVLLLCIGIIPYIRFFVLANHSYRHSFFTFRAQLVSIMAILGILLDSIHAKKDSIKTIFMKEEKNNQE